MTDRGSSPPGRTLIAGVGNIFLGDDAFGPEVARRLAAKELPGWVRVADYGISGMHLAYDLAEGYEMAILVDAAPRGGRPGTVTVLEVAAEHRRDLAAAAGPLGASRLFDSHGMQPDVVLGALVVIGAGGPAAAARSRRCSAATSSTVTVPGLPPRGAASTRMAVS